MNPHIEPFFKKKRKMKKKEMWGNQIHGVKKKLKTLKVASSAVMSQDKKVFISEKVLCIL